MDIKHITRFVLTALLLAWSFDLLFWGKTPGVSFLIFVLLCLGAGLTLTKVMQVKPPLSSLILILPVLTFAGITFIRLEPFTIFISVLLSLGSLVLLSITWLGGRWWQYNLGDHIQNLLFWIGYVLVKPAQAYIQNRKSTSDVDHAGQRKNLPGKSQETNPNILNKSTTPKPIWSILLGLCLAFPVVSLLASLLAAADPIFSQQLRNLLAIVNLEKLGEYTFRLTYILILAYIFSGIFISALVFSSQEKLRSTEKPWLPPFFGWMVSVTVLVCVDLLFVLFVAIQFRYFFGGQRNITLEGFTYAEYARRGFSELVVVAFISLLLLLIFSMLTRKPTLQSHRTISLLSIVLVCLVGIILVSAYQRLLLYESAYGFSRLRTYTHIFIIWLGILLSLVIFLEIFAALRYFPLAALMVCTGFGISLAAVNVDANIVHQNIQRAAEGAELDFSYLVGELSDDSVPALFQEYHHPQMSADLHHEIGGIIACRAELHRSKKVPASWTAFHYARLRAARLYEAQQEVLAIYPTFWRYRRLMVVIQNTERDCFAPAYIVE